jgi:hypothetical protein
VVLSGLVDIDGVVASAFGATGEPDRVGSKVLGFWGGGVDVEGLKILLHHFEGIERVGREPLFVGDEGGESVSIP